MAYIVQPPPAFDVNGDNVGDRFVQFRNKFDLFMRANGFDSKEEGQKIAILKSFCGEDLLHQIEEDETPEDTFDDILQRLQDYYTPSTNQLQQRFKFFIRRQRPNENFEKYLIEMKKMVKGCNFGDLEESLMKIVLIMNVKDNVEQQNILKTGDTQKLEELVPEFRKFDATREQFFKKKREPNQRNNPSHQPPTQKQHPPHSGKKVHEHQNPPSAKKEHHQKHNPKQNQGHPNKDGNSAGASGAQGEQKKKFSKPHNKGNAPGKSDDKGVPDILDNLWERVNKLNTGGK